MLVVVFNRNRELFDCRVDVAGSQGGPSQIEGFPDGAELAASAWGFPGINAGYRSYLDFVSKAPARRKDGGIDFEWVREEGERWRVAVAKDPMLPARIGTASVEQLLPRTGTTRLPSNSPSMTGNCAPS